LRFEYIEQRNRGGVQGMGIDNIIRQELKGEEENITKRRWEKKNKNVKSKI
jgi:hypothetical protein